MKIRPLNDVVFLTPLNLTPNQTILVVNPVVDTARIIAVPEKLSKEYELYEGSIVKFDHQAAAEQKIDGVSYLMIRFKDIIAILE